ARVQTKESRARAGRLPGRGVLVGRHRRHQPVARRRVEPPPGRGDGRYLARGRAARCPARRGDRRVPYGACDHARPTLAGGAGLLDPAGGAGVQSACDRRRGAKRRHHCPEGGVAMRPMLTQLTALIALGSSAGIALAQTTGPKVATTTPPTRVESSSQVPAGYRGVIGQVAVGENAPGFELTNADGDHVRLSSFSGTRVLLCFAERRESIAPYRAVAESLLVNGVRLVMISHDSPRSLKALADREGLTFELLSDPTG